jgi:hypothetical protein
MLRSAPFRLNRSGLMLMLVAAAFSGEASAAAGRVEFTIGGATISRNGTERPLARGTELDNGDTVRTNDGRAQIRFTDGAYVSLQPNTEYSIKDYQYGGGAQGEERGFFGLLKGAMRTVTGAIGRINRDRYQIATPTATVGIRGTGGVIQVQDDGSTRVIGTSGIWSLTNPAGSVDVPAGTSALAPTDPNQPPQETTEAPTSGPAPVQEEQPEFIAGEERDDTGNVVIPPPQLGPLVSGSGFLGILTYGDPDNPFMDPVVGDTQFNAAGQLTQIIDQSGSGVNFTLAPGGNVRESGNDGILAWGRWTGRVTGQYSCDGLCNFDVTFSDNQGFHYVVGMPTTAMPASGSASYSVLGATNPTYLDGAVPPGTLTGSLTVNFGATPTLGMNLSIAMPDSRGYALGGSIPISGVAFVGISSGGQGNGLTVSGSGGACSSGCDALVTGFFAGTNAERVGLGYHVNDFLANKDVVGAAAFQKQ